MSYVDDMIDDLLDRLLDDEDTKKKRRKKVKRLVLTPEQKAKLDGEAKKLDEGWQLSD